MADQVEIQLPKTRFLEGSGFTATAYFRTRSTAAASTPTTVHYRIDCLSTNTQVADWTTVSAAANVSISITPTHNKIQSDDSTKERKQITVKADKDLTTQAVGKAIYIVENLYGFT